MLRVPGTFIRAYSIRGQIHISICDTIAHELGINQKLASDMVSDIIETRAEFVCEFVKCQFEEAKLEWAAPESSYSLLTTLLTLLKQQNKSPDPLVTPVSPDKPPVSYGRVKDTAYFSASSRGADDSRGTKGALLKRATGKDEKKCHVGPTSGRVATPPVQIPTSAIEVEIDGSPYYVDSKDELCNEFAQAKREAIQNILDNGKGKNFVTEVMPKIRAIQNMKMYMSGQNGASVQIIQ